MITICIAAALTYQSPTFDLTLLPTGTFHRLGGYRPFKLTLTDQKPAGIVKVPDMASPRYGSIKVQGREFLVAMDGDDKLYVDENGDGDLTNDPPATWAVKTFQRAGVSYSSKEGTAMIDLNVGGKAVPCEVDFYENGSFIGYHMDFSMVGKLNDGAKSYGVMYIDESGAWDGTGGMLVIDEKGDGKLGPSLFHPVGKPFMLDGKEYEFGSVHGSYGLLPSTKKIEAPAPDVNPNDSNGLKPGVPARIFEATTTAGNKVSFPSSYKGKVVMLDFWATWCGPCMREAPNVVKAYQAYHTKGFEVLGISLDQEGAAATVKDVTGKVGMAWEQVYDGKYFQAAIAQQYGIKAIPEAYLVDGDTGKIIACGDAIRGDKLAPAIEKALASKSGQHPQ